MHCECDTPQQAVHDLNKEMTRLASWLWGLNVLIVGLYNIESQGQDNCLQTQTNSFSSEDHSLSLQLMDWIWWYEWADLYHKHFWDATSQLITIISPGLIILHQGPFFIFREWPAISCILPCSCLAISWRNSGLNISNETFRLAVYFSPQMDWIALQGKSNHCNVFCASFVIS